MSPKACTASNSPSCSKTDTQSGASNPPHLIFARRIAITARQPCTPYRTRQPDLHLTIYPRDLARLICAGLITFVGLGFWGHIFPTGDSLAVFRPEAAALLLPAAALAYALGARRTPALSILTALIAALSILRFAGTGDEVENPTLTLRSHNMLFGNLDRGRLVEELVTSGADVVAVQEVGYHNTEALRDAEAAFPYYHFCRYSRGGVAVLARNTETLLASGCAEKTELAWIRIQTAKGPVTVASLHLRWPWPSPQFWQVKLVEEEIARLEPPVVLAGDFNMVPWASAVDRIAQAAGGQIGRGLAPTYHIFEPWPSFRIDNVIAPARAQLYVERTDKMGSDHHGLLAHIHLP